MIGLGEASGIYAGMTWTRLRRGRLLWVSGVLLMLPVLAAVGLLAGGHWGRGLFDELLEIYFRFLVPFVPALLASPCVAEEIENKTFTFVFARPAPRPALVLGKYIAVALPIALATAVSIALTWLISMLRFPSDLGDTVTHLLRAEAAAMLGVLAFAALASAFGSMFTRHPFVAVMGYLLIIEAGLGSAPIVLNLLAVSWHLRNLADLPLAEISFMAIHVPAWGSAVVAAFVGALGVGLAALSVSGAEYHGR
jgi:ABC-type transport system involved in multi-copper enzyme maturation permease subunit